MNCRVYKGYFILSPSSSRHIIVDVEGDTVGVERHLIQAIGFVDSLKSASDHPEDV